MKRFWPPLLCASALVALSIWGLSQAWIDQTAWEDALGATMLALLLATVGALIWAVAGRVRGSLLKTILLWTVAAPTVLVALLFAGLSIFDMITPPTGGGGDDEMGLVLIPLLLMVLCGIGLLLVLAALPKKIGSHDA